MDASHIVVAALTGITLALLVWVEIRSRRNSAAEQRTRLQDVSAETAGELSSMSRGPGAEMPRYRKRARGQLHNSQYQNIGSDTSQG